MAMTRTTIERVTKLAELKSNRLKYRSNKAPMPVPVSTPIKVADRMFVSTMYSTQETINGIVEGMMA
jgi:hypothetical protein